MLADDHHEAVQAKAGAMSLGDWLAVVWAMCPLEDEPWRAIGGDVEQVALLLYERRDGLRVVVEASLSEELVQVSIWDNGHYVLGVPFPVDLLEVGHMGLEVACIGPA